MYLATPNTEQVRQAVEDGLLGAMLSQHSWKGLNADHVFRFRHIGLDNGCFNDTWDEAHWLRWLDRMAPIGERCLFAVVPDVFDRDDLANNHRRTLERWYLYRDEVTMRGLPAAFVAQNGCTPDDVPPEAHAVFIGGDTRWKLSEQAWSVVSASKAHGQWVHVGRVNTMGRIRACHLSGVDSVDGTFLRWPDTNLPKLLRYLKWINTHRPFAFFGDVS